MGENLICQYHEYAIGYLMHNNNKKLYGGFCGGKVVVVIEMK